MDPALVNEDLSFDVEDWEVEEGLPGESEICLCSDVSSDIDEHDQLMCAWYTAMKEASELTSLPPPWEENLLDDFNTTDDTNEAELPPLCPEEYFAFDQMSTSVPPSISGSVQVETSDLQAASLIHTDPEKIAAARTEAFRRKSTARKAKLRHAHLKRIDRLKLERSQRGEDDTDMQIDQDAGLQTLPPIDDYMSASQPSPTLMDNPWLVRSEEVFKTPPSDMLEPIVPTKPETLAKAASLQAWCQTQEKILSTWAETTTKPPYTYPELARMALLRKPHTPLSSAEIRNWITDHFAYYRHTEVPWRHGVNSCLGACESFVVVGGMTDRWRLAVRPRSFAVGDMAVFLATGGDMMS